MKMREQQYSKIFKYPIQTLTRRCCELVGIYEFFSKTFIYFFFVLFLTIYSYIVIVSYGEIDFCIFLCLGLHLPNYSLIYVSHLKQLHFKVMWM